MCQVASADYTHDIATHRGKTRSKTVKELKAGKLALAQVIQAMGLTAESEIIDRLFEQAVAIKSDSGQVVENKPPEASPAKS